MLLSPPTLGKRSNTSSTPPSSKKTKQSPKALQKGTGLHIDSRPYNLWAKLKTDCVTYETLDRFRPFQSFVALTDGDSRRKLEDGGLEVVPGFAAVAEKYFPAMDVKLRQGKSLRKKFPFVSPYHIGLNQTEDKPLHELLRKVQRMPSDWSPPVASNVLQQDLNAYQCMQYVKQVVKEHDDLSFVPIQKGDFVLFDIRMAHQNSNSNKMTTPRSVFYHAYYVAHNVNKKGIASIRERRITFDHPSDFSSKYHAEKDHMDTDRDLVKLTELGKCLFNEKEYGDMLNPGGEIEQILNKYGCLLTPRHIDYFHRFGYVVVENLVDEKDCDQLLSELIHYSNKAGCPLGNSMTNDEWQRIGGTFGAMVEFYYLPMQQRIRLNEKLYATTVNLLSHTWCNSGRNDNPWCVPYVCPFAHELDYRKLWVYIDRMNYRLPENHNQRTLVDFVKK